MAEYRHLPFCHFVTFLCHFSHFAHFVSHFVTFLLQGVIRGDCCAAVAAVECAQMLGKVFTNYAVCIIIEGNEGSKKLLMEGVEKMGKTMILFYSFGGSTRTWAENEAATRGASLYEVREARKRNIFTAFLSGCPMAMHQKTPRLAEAIPDLTEYETIVLAAPVWAGFPAPAFNAMVAALPRGAKVEVVLRSSGSGTANARPQVEAAIRAQGAEVASYTDLTETAKK